MLRLLLRLLVSGIDRGEGGKEEEVKEAEAEEDCERDPQMVGPSLFAALPRGPQIPAPPHPAPPYLPLKTHTLDWQRLHAGGLKAVDKIVREDVACLSKLQSVANAVRLGICSNL